MTRLEAPDERVQAKADEVRAVLEQVLAEAAAGDWQAASRRVEVLVHAVRGVQTEVDFRTMSEWLEGYAAA
jgi:hydroxypyruvate isomerase